MIEDRKEFFHKITMIYWCMTGLDLSLSDLKHYMSQKEFDTLFEIRNKLSYLYDSLKKESQLKDKKDD